MAAKAARLQRRLRRRQRCLFALIANGIFWGALALQADQQPPREPYPHTPLPLTPCPQPTPLSGHAFWTGRQRRRLRRRENRLINCRKIFDLFYFWSPAPAVASNMPYAICCPSLPISLFLSLSLHPSLLVFPHLPLSPCSSRFVRVHANIFGSCSSSVFLHFCIFNVLLNANVHNFISEHACVSLCMCVCVVVSFISTFVPVKSQRDVKIFFN